MDDSHNPQSESMPNQAQTLRWIFELEAELTRTEHDAKQNIERDLYYRSLLELSPCGVLVFDTRGTVVESNHAFHELTGFSREEILGKHISRLPTVKARGIPVYIRLFASILKGNSLRRFEFEWHHKDGTAHYGQAYGGLVKTGQKVSGIQVVLFDTTERKQAEEVLRGSEVNFRQLLENAAVGIFVVNREWRFLYLNPAATAITGFTLEDFQKDPLLRLIDSDDTTNVPIHGQRRLAKHPADTPYELVYRKKGGGKLSVEASASPTQWYGQAAHLVMFHDVSDRKRAEAALQQNAAELAAANQQLEAEMSERQETEAKLSQSEVNFRALAQDSQDAISIFRENRKTDYTNERIYDWLGYTRGDPAATPPWKRLLPEHLAMMRELAHMPVEDQGIHQAKELAYVKKDGSILSVEVLRTRTTWNGKPAVLRVMRDITQRKQLEEERVKSANQMASMVQNLEDEIRVRSDTEEALSQSEENFRALAENSVDGISIRLLSGELVYTNPGLPGLTGYTSDELVAMKPLELFPSRLRKAMREKHLGRLRGEFTESNFETMLLAKNGAELPVEISATVTQWQGQPAILVTAHDTSERKRVEAEQTRIDKLQSVGVLAGGIAHDFNNILTGILGNINLARIYTRPEDKTFDLLQSAEQATIRAKELTQRLITFASGGAPVRRVMQIENSIRDWANAALHSPSVRCRFTLPPGLWSANLDEGQMAQVIGHLVTNAEQAMPKGGTVQVRVSNVDAGSESRLPITAGSFVCVTVADKGTGIEPKYLAKIFDPYFTTKEMGSGLGLSVVYSVVNKHGGFIDVKSTPGKGSAFSLYLPAVRSQTATVTPPDIRADTGKGRLLVMDDEQTVRQVVERLVEHLGYRADLVASGEEALRRYRTSMKAGNPYRAVILDLIVPGAMGGQEAVRQLLKLDPGVRAIVASGYVDDPVMSNHSAYGFTAAIAKPFLLDELAMVLEAVLPE